MEKKDNVAINIHNVVINIQTKYTSSRETVFLIQHNRTDVICYYQIGKRGWRTVFYAFAYSKNEKSDSFIVYLKTINIRYKNDSLVPLKNIKRNNQSIRHLEKYVLNFKHSIIKS
jgi:hypothetical protein